MPQDEVINDREMDVMLPSLINIDYDSDFPVTDIIQVFEFLELSLDKGNDVKLIRKHLINSDLFDEGLDYCIIPIASEETLVDNQGLTKEELEKRGISTRFKKSFKYAVTLDCAKMLSATIRSKKQKLVLKYLLECEKKLKSLMKQLPEDYSTALRQLADYHDEIKEAKPKVEFFDLVKEEEDLYSIGEVAKILRQRGIGRNNLYLLLDGKFLDKKRIPYQKYIESGLFEYKIGKKVMVTSKGLIKIQEELGVIDTINRSTWSNNEIIDELNKSFLQLKFDSSSHTYKVNGNQRTSVTTFTKDYKPDFPAQIIAAKCAAKGARERDYKYAGMSKQQILDQWAATSKKAADSGTIVHDALENYIDTDGEDFGREIFPDTVEGKKIIQGTLFLQDYLNEYEYLIPELRIYSEEYPLAGTIDLIARNKKTGNLALIDWKTNKDLLNSRSAYLKAPFNAYPATDLNGYMLQLSTYKLILESSTAFKVDELVIVHLLEDKYVRYDVKDVSEIIKAGL